jgi:O-antigen ligase
MRDRLARVAAMLSLGLTAVLVVRIIAIGKPGVFIILFPALAGALLALWRRGRATLVVSAVLTALTAVVLLIGGVGLLYLPPIVMFAWGAVVWEGRAGKTDPAGGLHTF